LFENIKQLWSESRGDVARKEVEDILLRYKRMDPNSQYFVSGAFTHTLEELEDELGALSDWDTARKKAVSEEMKTAARSAFNTPGTSIRAETGRLGAHGGALLALYIELQTLPGDQAKAALEAICRWKASLS
jgi:hypothetical protein